MALGLRGFILLYAFTSLTLILGSALLGLLMRFSQAGLVFLAPAQFYQFVTLHGLGMASATIAASMVLSAVGLGVSTLVGGMGVGWTMLHPLPLPRFSSGQWGNWAAELFMLPSCPRALRLIAWWLR